MPKRRAGKRNPAPSSGAAPSTKEKAKPPSGGPIRTALRFLGSLKLAVALLLVLVFVLAAATLLESSRGTEFSQRYVYHSGWFIALWTLVTLNVLAAMLAQWPRRIRQAGILITHLGLVALLAGSIHSYMAGIEGRLTFAEGQTSDTIVISHLTQLTTTWREGDFETSLDFSFRPGPTDWPAGKTMDLGESDDVRIEILEFYRHARSQINWVEDATGRSVPAIKFELLGSRGTPVATEWLAARRFASERTVGPAKFTLYEVPVRLMVDDLLAPPDDELGSAGLLSVYHQDRATRVSVAENVGKKVAIGDDGATVEIVEYLPNGTASAGGKFTSTGDKPLNPMLELLVHLPGGGEPLRQIAFAKTPFLNLDGSRRKTCPVKFFYNHPDVPAQAGTEVFQTPDGKLYCRVCSGGQYESRGEVKQGDRIEAFSGFTVHLLEHLLHAKREMEFLPVDPNELESGQAEKFSPAVHAKVVVGGETHQIWLHRGNRQHGSQRIRTSKGLMEVSFGYAERPLGFSLTLLDFTRGLNPGGMGDASYASLVRLEDESQGVNLEQTISMNQPLTHGKFTFYQSSFHRAPDGRDMSILSAAHDPGRFLKYFGSLMICVGTFVIFYLKRLVSKIRPKAASAGQESSIRNSIATLTILLAMSVSTASGQEPGGAFDWDQWQRLPVQEGGRQKPLDTLAREAFWKMGGGAVTSPETGKNPAPTAAFLEMLLQWQGWDQPPEKSATSPHSTSPHGMTPPGDYFGSHQADRWDRAPLLLVDGVKLRRALDMAEDRANISPQELAQAQIPDPDTGEKTPFTFWARKIYFSKETDFSESEKKGVMELSQKLQSFQTLRMGQSIQVIPVKGDQDQRWMSLADLMRADFNDRTDPSGELRNVKKHFRDARTAYLAGRGETFNQASAALIASLQKLGPQHGDYPCQATIDLEVSYNRWAPFTWAWICCLIASVALVLSICTGRRVCYTTALTALGAALVALLAGLAMRTVIKGSPPVTNLYESVVFSGFGAVLFGLVFGLKARRQGILAATLVIATLILGLADSCPSVLDPAIRPLPPVLRSNFWLAVHVATIMLSYSAFAVALGIANVTLGFYLAGSKRHEAIKTQSRFTLETLQAGTILLVAGTFLGAAWADYSWGRFWGWDPKEVWALITLLGYLAILHARRVGWVGNRGLAAWSVICFMLVMMTWYGVNFLSGGLHNYGLGGGEGPFYMLGAIGLQLLYVAAAIVRSANKTA